MRRTSVSNQLAMKAPRSGLSEAAANRSACHTISLEAFLQNLLPALDGYLSDPNLFTCAVSITSLLAPRILKIYKYIQQSCIFSQSRAWREIYNLHASIIRLNSIEKETKYMQINYESLLFVCLLNKVHSYIFCYSSLLISGML